MSSPWPWLGLVLALGLGFLVGWAWQRARHAGLGERLRWLEERLARAEPLAQESEQLRSALREEQIRREADAERLAWIHTADEQLRTSFHSLASQLLRTGSEDLVDRSRDELRGVVEPLQRLLGGLDEHVRQLEKDRQGAYQGLRRELDLLRQAQRELHGTTRDLKQALRSSGPRGRWGEIQLRRIVELAGMVEHVDFVEQPTLDDRRRPDMVIRLPGGGRLAIDAKVPLDAYLAASEAEDPATRRRHLDEHAKALERRTTELGGRKYFDRLEGSPDFVVMFLPHEGGLAAAFERNPRLLDFCVERRVLPATPVTLLALLTSVAWGWRQQTVTEGAARIADAGRELQSRLAAFVDHLGKVGRGLEGATQAYNRALGSLERRVLPATRRLEAAAAIDPPLATPTTLGEPVREPAEIVVGCKVPEDPIEGPG